MIAEIGVLALILSLIAASLQCIPPLIGAHRHHPQLMAFARPATTVQFISTSIAFGCLISLFVNNDFSVLNVASNSNKSLPLIYRICASWGSHEGSILLWCLMLSGWSFAVARFSKHLPMTMVARILGVMGFISIGTLLFTLLTSNPFLRLLPAVGNGKDLNPLLQDPGMIIHPPMLYMGYVGMSVVFAFAIAALLAGRLDTAWAKWSRPWITIAWCFLTIGIALGSAWAYYELGWGGWWFWDPVENASFMPWLLGTALMHSLAVTEKRGGFKMWTALLAILTFSLSLLGTFLVRSGVLTSVHAFATDPTRGIFILVFLAIVIGGSLTLFAIRAPRSAVGENFDMVSKESMLLANNVLFMVATAAVLLGTLYPLILDAFGIGKISVGKPYFESVFVPLMAPALFLMGIGPIAKWRKAPALEILTQLRWALGITIVSAAITPFIVKSWSPLIGLGLGIAVWIVISSISTLIIRIRQTPKYTWTQTLRKQNASYYGMLLAHIGVAVFIVGVTMVGGFEEEKDVRMSTGSVATVGGYEFKFEGLRRISGENYISTQGQLSISKNGQFITKMLPEKRIYASSQMPMTEAAIHSMFTGDLYISMAEPVSDSEWGIKIQYKPFVSWIWTGCLFMALGGLLAILDSRYRKRLHTV